MTNLSPAALAVMTAGTMGNPNVINDPVYRQCIAAALRAAADGCDPDWLALTVLHHLYAIADELERAALAASKATAARRPQPPTLKEQALEILATAGGPDHPRQMTVLNTDQHILIKRALEALP